jgi:hypothetical protein
MASARSGAPRSGGPTIPCTLACLVADCATAAEVPQHVSLDTLVPEQRWHWTRFVAASALSHRGGGEEQHQH